MIDLRCRTCRYLDFLFSSLRHPKVRVSEDWGWESGVCSWFLVFWGEKRYEQWGSLFS